MAPETKHWQDALMFELKFASVGLGFDLENLWENEDFGTSWTPSIEFTNCPLPFRSTHYELLQRTLSQVDKIRTELFWSGKVFHSRSWVYDDHKDLSFRSHNMSQRHTWKRRWNISGIRGKWPNLTEAKPGRICNEVCPASLSVSEFETKMV